MFIECVYDKVVKTRVGSAFTLGIWNEHNNDPNNLDKIELLIKRPKVFRRNLLGEINCQIWIIIGTNKKKKQTHRNFS